MDKINKIQDPNTPKYNITTGQPTDYGNSIGVPKVNPVIDSGSMLNDGSLNLPDTKTTPVNPTVTLPDVTTDTQKEVAKINAQKTSAETGITDLMKQVGIITGKENTIATEQGADTAQKEYDKYSSDLTAEQRALELKKREILSNGSMTSSQANSEITAQERQSLQKQADIAILGNAAKGRYDTARSIAKEKVDAMLAPVKAELEAKKFLYESNKDLFSKAELSTLDALIKKDEAKIKKDEATAKTIEDVKLEYAKNGGKDFSAFKDVKTVDDALKAAGSYLASGANEFQKIKNADGSETLVLMNKVTGKTVSSYGGNNVDTTPTGKSLIRTITQPDGKQVSVDGYTLQNGDDPYFIAKKNGLTFDELKKINPNIIDWTKLPVGAVINIPNKTTTGSLLAATDLSQLAMEYLKQGTTALTRLDKGTRQKVFDEVANFTKSRGIDEATFRQQYNAIGKTVEANVLRNNQAVVAENELTGTIDNLRNAATEANLQDLRQLNIAKVWAGTQLNSPEQQTFKFHLEQLRTEFAMYNAALSGQIDANGNIRQIDDADKKRADELIQRGFSTGSIDGFEKALKASTGKMSAVLQNSIDAQNKAVWKLFGVEDQYQPVGIKVDPMTAINEFDSKNPTVIDEIHKEFPDAGVEEIYQYLKDKGYIK